MTRERKPKRKTRRTEDRKQRKQTPPEHDEEEQSNNEAQQLVEELERNLRANSTLLRKATPKWEKAKTALEAKTAEHQNIEKEYA